MHDDSPGCPIKRHVLEGQSIYSIQVEYGSTSCDNNIIFTGESGDSTAVVLTGSGTVLNLNGVDGLTFQYMT
ncbi:MAG: hypothetical protein AAFS00_14045, partial [Bacteroidota bacterium]